MIRVYRLWLLRQQRRRQQKRNEEVRASLSIRLVGGSLYVANGKTLAHRFSLTDKVSDVVAKINEIRRMNL